MADSDTQAIKDFNIVKFHKALRNLYGNLQINVIGDITSEDDFDNNITWIDDKPDGCDYTTVKAEMDKL